MSTARHPAINLPPPVLWVSGLLIAVHLARQAIPPEADTWILLTFAFTPARYGELRDLLPGGLAAGVWSPLTYSLLHADTVHLVVNLVWMAAFGAALARRWGGARFLLLAAAASVGGAGLHFALHTQDEAIMVGASGAVSGIMAATARFAFSPGGPLGGGGSDRAYLVPAEPIVRVFGNPRALAFILIWFAMNLLFGLVEGVVPGSPGPIAWEAHVGGFLVGFLLFPLLDPIRTDGAPEDPLTS